jgi:hypothetical protein
MPVWSRASEEKKFDSPFSVRPPLARRSIVCAAKQAASVMVNAEQYRMTCMDVSAPDTQNWK